MGRRPRGRRRVLRASPAWHSRRSVRRPGWIKRSSRCSVWMSPPVVCGASGLAREEVNAATLFSLD